ncbi:MAG TPA: DUF6152 family protein [Bryobacteraceae bacterium]|jgi:hypothetical protein|nr:DUF6152 family protein [Bryobacteraceae bacterium]
MKTKLVVCMAGLLVAAAVPLLAHHSFAAEYDANAKLTLKGTVTKVDWMNPHIWVYVDAKDEAGKMIHWQCEGGPPNTLTRNGWTKDALKIGDEVTIEGFRAKDGTNTCNSRSVTLPDGRRVFAGSADDNGPKARGEN